jgi:hypothetical protein
VKLFQVPQTGLHVELRTRDEHCPPHVHVENRAVPWEARLVFSFVSDLVRLLDIDPIEDAPSTRTIDWIKTAIAANLSRCRAEWWAKVGTACLDNRWVLVLRDGMVTILARREKGAIQIGTATYEPRTGKTTLITKDGARLAIQAGAGVEQWEP